MKKCFVFLIATLLSCFGFSEEFMDITIDKAIKLALKNNYMYLISKEGVKRYKYRLNQNFNFLPTVTLEGARNLDEKLMELEMPPMLPGDEPMKISIDFTKDYEFTLQVVQPVFTGGKILNAFRNAKIDLKIAKERQENVKDEVILNIKKMFYNVLVMKELHKAHKEALDLAENNYRNVEERYKLGMVSKYDLLRSELSVASIKPIILNVEKNIKLLVLNLKTMLGIPESTGINISGTLSYSEYQLDVSDLINKSLISRSEILQLKMEEEKTRNLLKIAYAQYLPDFSIIARYSYRSDFFRFQGGNWEDYYTINLGVSFPIFLGLKRSGQIGELKVLKKILRMNLEDLYNATKVQVQNHYLSIQKEFKNIQAGLKNIETANEGVRIADLNYKEGLISILELNSSYNELTSAKVAYLQAVYNYNIALAELEKISGQIINGGKR